MRGATISSTTAGGSANLVHHARRKLRVAKADGWCGSLGQERGRVHGPLAVVGEIRRVGIGLMAVVGLVAVVIVELRRIFRAGVGTRPGAGGRLESQLSEERFKFWIGLRIAGTAAARHTIVRHGRRALRGVRCSAMQRQLAAADDEEMGLGWKEEEPQVFFG